VARKGRLDEIFSKALYADDATLYVVSYRDFDSIVEVPLPVRIFCGDTAEQNSSCQKR
jgi:hypothetical protein